jgi:hypothetical protein
MKILPAIFAALALYSSVTAQRTPASAQQGKMHDPKYCLFYDNHTMPDLPDVGANFDVEAFTDRIKRCGVDYLTFHARDNMGMAYYDTKIGIRHPSLKYDLFGKLSESCQRKGIALGAYINGGLSHAEGVEHREWTTISFDGKEYSEPRTGPFVRRMCYNTPYRDHLIGMIKEIATNYPISGLFVDCMVNDECICPICIKEMKSRGIDWTKREEVAKFTHFSALRLARDIVAALKPIKPHLLLYFNVLGYEDDSDVVSYYDVECLPTGAWGYEFLPTRAHFIRTLSNKPVLNMNGRFYDWGDFGGLRPEAAIQSELLYGLANGMRPNVGGHFHPRGDLENAVLDRIQKIYTHLQTMEPWFNGAKNEAEVAIVCQGMKDLNSAKTKATVRMLEELKQQFDIVTLYSDWSKYKVLVLPDDLLLSDSLAARVKAHLAAGKAVISSGSSGLNADTTAFALEKEWGVRYKGNCNFNPAYFTASAPYNQSLPDMPLSLYSHGIEMEPLAGAVVSGRLIKPYFNKEWDGIYPFYYTPPDSITNIPALTIHGKVAQFSHCIFSGYANLASVELRTVFANVLGQFLPNPIVKFDHLPSFSRVFVTDQPGRRMVHVLSYVPEMRGKTQMIEEPIELHNVKISLRSDGKPPKKVYLAGERTSLSFTTKDGYVQVTLPVSKGYSMIVFE